MISGTQALPIQQRHHGRILTLHNGMRAAEVRARTVSLRALPIISRPCLSPTPQDIAKDNPVTDDVLRAWTGLGGHLSLPKHYTYNTDLRLPSGTYIEGFDGLGGLYNPNPEAIHLRNLNFTFPGAEPVDHNITINGVDLSGNPHGVVPPTVNNIVFIGVRKLTITNCPVHDFRRHAITISNCPQYKINHNEIFNYGEAVAYTGKPEDWFAGCGLFAISPSDDGEFNYNRIHDGTGIAGWFDGGAKGLRCMFNTLARVAEAGFVGWPDGAMVIGNVGEDVTRPAISGHWIEGQGNNVSVIANRFKGAAGAIIFVTDGQGWVIGDNYLAGANQQPIVMTGAIILRTANPDPTTTIRNTSISGNQIVTLNGMRGQAITICNWSGRQDALMHDLAITCNPVGDPSQYTNSQPLLIAPQPDKPSGKSLVLGDRCSIVANPGIPDQ